MDSNFGPGSVVALILGAVLFLGGIAVVMSGQTTTANNASTITTGSGPSGAR
jgi:hypothetical protein